MGKFTLSNTIRWITLVVILCFSCETAFANIEVTVVPTSTSGIALLQSSTQPTRDETTALLQGTGTYSSGGAATGTLTYDFRHVLNLTRIELVTMQSGLAHTTHRIEVGVTMINLLVYEFNSDTTDGQTLTYTFNGDAQVRLVRINTLLSGSLGVAWRSIKIYASAAQFMPTTFQYYRLVPSANVFTTGSNTANLLFGTGSWSAGAAAVATPISLFYDLNQLTRVDFIELTVLNALPSTTTITLIGGSSVDSPDSAPILSYSNNAIAAGQVLWFPLNGTQYRSFQVSVANTGTSIVGFTLIRFFTAKATPELIFYPKQYGAVVVNPGSLQTIIPPTDNGGNFILSASIQAYSGGGGCTGYTGVAGSGVYFAGNITNFSVMQFVAGGAGNAFTQTGGWGNGVVDGGRGGGKITTGGQGGGGGGGGTYIATNSGTILAVLGGGGGAGGTVGTIGYGGNGGAGGLNGFTANGTPGRLLVSQTGGIGGAGGGATNPLGADGQALGGGAGGGGYNGGSGGGAATTYAGAGGGGGGATNMAISSGTSTINGMINSASVGPMPGAIQIVWDYPTQLVGATNSWPTTVPHTQASFWVQCGAATYQKIMLGLPIYYHLFGDGVTFDNGLQYFSTVTVVPQYTSTATVLLTGTVTSGSFVLMCQTSLGLQGGYLNYSRVIQIV